MELMLQTTDLCKSFKKQKVVNHVSLNIEKGKVYGLLGPNGAGKSTTLKMLTGILKPTAGEIYFDGKPWNRECLSRIGALIENPPVYGNLSARENLKVRSLLLGVDEKRIEEVLQIWNANINLTDEELLAMDEDEFRARVRERCHHTLEIQVYHAQHRDKKLSPTQADYAKRLMRLWKERGLSTDLPEYRYVSFLIETADKLANGEHVDLSAYKPTPVTKEMEDAFFTILKERRSVREFTDEEVPDELIDKVLEAGLWAAHGCNVQSIRYVVVREKNEPGLFRGSDVPGGPVHLVICQNMRCYRANSFTPRRNQLLDAGAAGQNIVLAAHAAGLESVWLTFPNEEFCDRLRKKFNLPDYVRLVTYVDVGFGAQTPHPPLRWDVRDTVLGRF